MEHARKKTPIFSGEFRHALDPKNRVTIPARWRDGESEEFYLMVDRTRRFVRVMPPEQFRAVGEKLEANTQVDAQQKAAFRRWFYSSSRHVVSDKQGRLLVPEDLGREIGLEAEVVLVGAYETFELWSPAALQVVQATEKASSEAVAELLGL